MCSEKFSTLNKENLDQLRKQFEFIENSACLFDIGKTSEAIRIALALRVLIHDTGKSKSAFSFAGIKDKIKIMSTKGTDASFDGKKSFGFALTGVAMLGNPATPKLCANMHRINSKESLSVNDWWEENVLALIGLGSFSRREMCLVAANKDGGAHVDKIPQKFKDIQDGKTNMIVKAGSIELNFNEIWAYTLRQMAWEILNSEDVMVMRGLTLIEK